MFRLKMTSKSRKMSL